MCTLALAQASTSSDQKISSSSLGCVIHRTAAHLTPLLQCGPFGGRGLTGELVLVITSLECAGLAGGARVAGSARRRTRCRQGQRGMRRARGRGARRISAAAYPVPTAPARGAAVLVVALPPHTKGHETRFPTPRAFSRFPHAAHTRTVRVSPPTAASEEDGAAAAAAMPFRCDDLRGGALRGPFLVTLGAFIFAGANAAATGIYRRGGTIATTFLLRCVVVYIFNGAVVYLRQGRTEAVRVLLLRTGRKRSSLMAGARALTGAFMGVLLNLSFVLLA